MTSYNNVNDFAKLASLPLTAIVAAFNQGVDDYNPEHFSAVQGFKSKAHGVERIENMCAASSLALAFKGDDAVIVDAADVAPQGGDDAQGEGEGEGDAPQGESGDDAQGGDDAPQGEGEGDDAQGEGEGEGEGDFSATDTLLATGGGDGKGEVTAWGFARSSAAWLLANPRGGEAREAYRRERRKAARLNRKAARKAKEAARESA